MAYVLPIADPLAPADVSAKAQSLATAEAHYRHCLLCEHRCGVDRTAGERGECKAGPVPRLFRHRIEYSEEAELVPSHLFYLSGCDLRPRFASPRPTPLIRAGAACSMAKLFGPRWPGGKHAGPKPFSGSEASRQSICRRWSA